MVVSDGSGSSGLCTGQDAAGGEFLRYFPDVRAAPPGDISDSRPSVLDCSREAGTIVPDACRKNSLADPGANVLLTHPQKDIIWDFPVGALFILQPPQQITASIMAAVANS